MAIQWPCNGHSMATQWPFNGHSMAIQRPFNGQSMAIQGPAVACLGLTPPPSLSFAGAHM
eukprot:5464512-Lingulodinium_polyedra.AAC.1